MSESEQGRTARGPAAIGLGALVGFAGLLRCIGIENVFLADGRVVFANSDAFYHVRRSLYNLAHFPDFLKTDACINFPDGASVPHAPGYDVVVAALATLAGGSPARMELVAAWLPVALGALGVLPVYALGRICRGRALGFGAAIIYAVLPIAINYSRVGNADHHAAAGLLGATLLALYAALLSERGGAGRLPLLFAGLTLTRTSMLLVWHGSLLYFAVGEIVLLLAALLTGRRDWLRGQVFSCLATALLISPVVALTALPRDGLYSATELSRLPGLLFVANAGICGVLLIAMRSPGLAKARSRLLAGCGIALAFAVALGMLPGVLEGLRPALEFLTKSDAWGSSVHEQLPLFYARGELRAAAGQRWLGGLAYLLPVIPLAFVPLLERRELRWVAVLAIAWSLLFGALAFSQVRYANDYAAVGSLGGALLVAQASQLIARKTWPCARPVLATLGGLLLLAPVWPRYFAIALDASLAARAQGGDVDRALLSLQGTQLRFAERVRELTPQSPGCGPEAGRPDYGILAHPAIGHVLHYVARRATPADPFGPYIGQRNFDLMRRAFAATSEDEILRIAEQLQTPYLLTAADVGAEGPESVVQRLHRQDGSAEGSLPQLGRFRLLHEGPEGGVPVAAYFAEEDTGQVPYKLFEIVQGALLEVPARPGSSVVAVVSVRVASGRRFSYRAVGVADASGFARLRVPYATDASGPGATRGAYTVVSSDRRWQVEVPEAAVLGGAVLRVGD